MNQQILNDIIAERQRQDTKFGLQNHSPEKWLTILTEKVGEFATEVLDAPVYGTDTLMRAKMVQVAAVAVAVIEYLDRRAVLAGVE